MNRVDEFARRYVILCLRIDKIIPGFVDAYMGPKELRERIAAENKSNLTSLLDESRHLSTELKKVEYEEKRHNFLKKQLLAVTTTLRELKGEQIPYEEKISKYYDITPQFDPEEKFERAISELDNLLPGRGSVRDRMIERNEKFLLPPTKLLELIWRVVRETKKRTQEFIDMPREENLEIELVQGRNFNGFNAYLGNYKSLVQVNTPLRGFDLIPLMCHEAYCGHHVERSMKEKVLYKMRGFGEHEVFVWRSPENLLANGIGNNASAVLFEDREIQDWLAKNIYEESGIEALDVTQETKIAITMRDLSGVRVNAARMLHQENATVTQVRDYVKKYMLTNEEQTDRVLNRIIDPFLHMNIHVYHFGEKLVRNYIERGERRQRFCSLLTEQVYPSLLRDGY